MDAVTDEERRKVADELRFYASNSRDLSTAYDFSRDVFRATMSNGILSYRHLILRLADLIEPSEENK